MGPNALYARKEQPDDTIVFARGRGVMQGGIVVPFRAGRSAYVHGVVSR